MSMFKSGDSSRMFKSGDSSRKTIKQIMGDTNYSNLKKIDHNTIRYTDFFGSEKIRLHNTDIITFQKDGKTILNSGGWMTPTTKDRLNKYSGYRIHQEKGLWYIGNIVFKDGIQLSKITSGEIESIGAGSENKLLKQRKQVKKYVAEFVSRLIDGKIKKPSSGDCWICLMKDDKGNQVFTDHDHIQSHIKERYFVPSLLINAVNQYGSQADKNDCAMYMKMEGFEKGAFFFSGNSQHYFVESISRILRRFLYRQSGI